ncbi:MAG TPA: oligosaccharide flippase family protein, partial [Patescibacteria group bacterium]|nr:oligosaccharide flippase family protein [Patescibacteria group bacterium]
MSESFENIEARDTTYRSLKYKAANGVFLLGIRRVAIQFIQTASSIILARLLFPEVFGTFAIILFIVSFFTVFTDIGFGAAIIQQKKKVEEKQLQTLFLTQICLSVFVT